MAEDLCRICLNYQDNHKITFNIFTQHSWEPSYACKITDITNIQIMKSDGLPENICAECAKRVDDCFHLKEQVQRSDEYLKSLNFEVKQVKTENEFVDETTVKCEQEFDNLAEHSEQIPEYKNVSKIEPKIDTKEPIASASSGEILKCTESDKFLEHYEIQEVQEDVNDEKAVNEENLEKLNGGKCNICGKEMRLKRSYMIHMRRHAEEKFHKCKHCTRTFLNKEALKKHMKLHSASRRGYQCNICEGTFGHPTTLAKHKASVHSVGTPKLFPCDICGRNFTRKGFMAKHKAAVHTSERFKELCCDICNLAFSHKAILTRHKRTAHNISRKSMKASVSKECVEDESNQSESVESDSNKQTKEIGENIEKDLAENEETGQQKSTLVEVGGDKQTEESKRITDAKQEQSDSVLPENKKKILHTEFVTMGPNVLKQYQCNICGRVMKSRSWLRIHIRMHNTEFAHKCEICGKSFYSKSRLKHHNKTHTGEKAAECFICYKSFSQVGHLRQHIRSVHDGETPYKCEVCSKMFKAKNSLKNHFITHHIAERNFACSECGKSFMRRDTLKKHMETHNVVKDVCNICGLAFGQKKAVLQHKRIVHTVHIESIPPGNEIEDKNEDAV